MALKRKILGYGYSKLLTLPAFWVKLHGLKKGDTVTIDLDENSNLLLRGKNGTHKTVR